MQRRRVLKVVAAAATAMLGIAAFAGPAAAFDDVDEDAFFGPAVEWMKEQGLTTGLGGTVDEPSDTFGPFDPVDRAQLATFLWRMAGSPEPTLEDDGFTDTQDDAYYTKAVRWLREKNYTTGIGGTQQAPGTTFEPHTQVDRAQAITLLWRYGGEPVGDPEPYGPHEFEDVDPGPPPTYFEAALRWAKAEGITTGYGGSDADPSDIFVPFEGLTRGQMAALVWRYAGFPDADDPGNTEEGAWAPGDGNGNGNGVEL
jgi:hypothetical protein